MSFPGDLSLRLTLSSRVARQMPGLKCFAPLVKTAMNTGE